MFDSAKNVSCSSDLGQCKAKAAYYISWCSCILVLGQVRIMFTLQGIVLAVLYLSDITRYSDNSNHTQEHNLLYVEAGTC